MEYKGKVLVEDSAKSEWILCKGMEKATTKIYEFLDICQTLIRCWPPFSSLLLQIVDKSLTITKKGGVRNMCVENLIFRRSHEYFKVYAKKVKMQCVLSLMLTKCTGNEIIWWFYLWFIDAFGSKTVLALPIGKKTWMWLSWFFTY